MDARDAYTGDLVWSVRPGPFFDGDPGISGSLLYVVTDVQGLLALDTATGQEVWLTATDQELLGPTVIADGVVYAISTRNGRLLARIPVGAGPHGLCVWPQPGRYSLGHTGILR